MNNPVIIVIPYFAKAAQGNELSLAVKGWEQFFKTPHRIIIVGDEPNILGVEHIPCPRAKARKNQYQVHLDLAAKFLAAMNENPAEPGFIYSCDDYYAVNKFILDDVKTLKVMPDTMPNKTDYFNPNPWRRDYAKTGTLCYKEGLGRRNWTTHTPQYFEADKMRELIERYDLLEQSHVIESLYFNTYHKNDIAYIMGYNNPFKLSVDFRPLDRAALHEAFSNRIWVNNSENGWSRELEEELTEYYAL